MTTKNSRSVKINLSPVTMTLTTVFITLKLTDVIDWSWWWVLSPLWIPLVTIGASALVALLIVSAIKRRK